MKKNAQKFCDTDTDSEDKVDTGKACNADPTAVDFCSFSRV